jgi:internalin A
MMEKTKEISLEEVVIGHLNQMALADCRELDLRFWRLRILPPEIGTIRNLRVLNISHNELTNIPPEIGNLQFLEQLNISYNSLSSLPQEIQKIKSLKTLYLEDNALPIPPEILRKSNNPKAIFSSYFGKFAGEIKKALDEAKMLVVGQGSVGKTSLVLRLTRKKFNPNENKTEGIQISHWNVFHADSKMKINVWDFGGQEIMHATHQFFLTKRSLYLLVLNARQTQEENRVEVWLKIIQAFGGDSPVIIVGNQVDQHSFDIDRTGLKKKYPNIVSILETSAATGAGIEELKAVIAEQVNNLPHVRDLLPET